MRRSTDTGAPEAAASSGALSSSTGTREPEHLQRKLIKSIPAILRNDNEPVFHEPWHAEVFAMVLSLYERGLFTWPEWAETLSQQITLAQQTGDADTGNTYYNHWLCALEQLLVIKNIGSEAQLAELYRRWHEAAQSTPHGQPIELPPNKQR